MSAVYITNLGAFFPNAPVANDEIESVLGRLNRRSAQVKDWTLNYNGIESRYYAVDQQTGEISHTNAEMTAGAVRAMASNGSFRIEQIECLACGTSSPDQLIPAHGSMVQHELGCPPCEVITTTGVCCSGMSALKYGYMNVASGQSRNAVTTGSELASPTLRSAHFNKQLEIRQETLDKKPVLPFESEFLRWMLSDGAGAVLIEDRPRDDRPSLRIDWIDLISYADQAETCMYSGGLKRKDGSLEGFRLIDDPNKLFGDGYLSLWQDVRVLRDALPRFCKDAFLRARARHGLDPSAIDWILPHYSSEGFRQPMYDGMVEERLEIPYEKWFTNLKWKGNTGAASIYIIMEELVSSGRAKEGDRIICMVPESARFTFSLMHLTVV